MNNDPLPNPVKNTTYVYILRLQSENLYIGCTRDYRARFNDHAKGFGARTTRLDPPIQIVWVEIHSTLISARQREAQLKKWSRAKKEALIQGRYDLLRQLGRPKSL